MPRVRLCCLSNDLTVTFPVASSSVKLCGVSMSTTVPMMLTREMRPSGVSM